MLVIVRNLSKGLKKTLPLLIFTLIITLFSLCLTPPEEVVKGKELTLYVGSCMGGAIKELANDFMADHPGITITVVAKGSAALLDDIGDVERGDVFMPGEESFTQDAIELGYIDSYFPVANHKLTVIVPEGNPMGISHLEDLTDDSVRVVAGGDEIAMGRMWTKAGGGTQTFEDIIDNYVYVEESKCSRIPKAVAGGQADVGISCVASSLKVDGVEYIGVQEFSEHSFIIPIGVLKFSEDEELAQDFVDFVTSDYGREIMAKHGFEALN